jgi:ADP-heptose:LPS heptosyltransferase
LKNVIYKPKDSSVGILQNCIGQRGKVIKQSSDRRVYVLFENGITFWIPLCDLQVIGSDEQLQEIKLSEKPIKILINRAAAYGDVLLIEPVIRALKRKYPNCEISIQTYCTDILKYCKLIKDVKEMFTETFDIHINLDNYSELNPKQNIIDAYATAAGVTLIDSERIPIYDESIKWTPVGKRIVVCTDRNWPTKNWKPERWKNVLTKLQQDGYEIIEVGMTSYLGVGQNYISTLYVHGTAELMATAELFICEDSLLFRIAQSIGIPTLVIIGCTSPKYIVHDWSKVKVLWTDKSKLDCAGCRHWRPVPLYSVDCLKRTVHCLDLITEEMFLDKFYNGKFGENTFVYD